MNNLSKPVLFVGCLFIVRSYNQRYEPGTMRHIKLNGVNVNDENNLRKYYSITTNF